MIRPSAASVLIRAVVSRRSAFLSLRHSKCSSYFVMAFATCVATAFEQRRSLPVDAMVPDPIFTSTHAITIDAAPDQVWPWIAQMGAGRAGWYSRDAIDNGGTPSARRVVPEPQTVVPGDVMPAVPGATDAFVVAALDPPRDLVLTVPDAHGSHAVAWEHVLEPIHSGRTRLIVRGRGSSHWLDLARAKPPAGHHRISIERAYAVLARLPRPLLLALARIGHRLMEARHLRGIQRRSTALINREARIEQCRKPLLTCGILAGVLSRDDDLRRDALGHLPRCESWRLPRAADSRKQCGDEQDRTYTHVQRGIPKGQDMIRLVVDRHETVARTARPGRVGLSRPAMRLVRGPVLAVVIAGAACGQRLPQPPGPEARPLNALEQLGKSVFFDQQLSLRGNQSCAACHAPVAGWTGDLPLVNAGPAVYEGSVSGLFGNRKPPTVAYAMAPVLRMTLEDGDALFVGGSFWDGRATGERLGDPIAEQAQGPFVNPVEQALPDTGCVVRRVCAADYPIMLDSQFPGSCRIAWPPDVDAACALPEGRLQMTPHDRATSDRAYDHIATAIAAYERSREVNPFSSKFDRHLAGDAVLSPEERAGLELFAGRGKCSACHTLDRGPRGELPLLTDFTFDNIGIPRNPENPWYRAMSNPAGRGWVDEGFGAFLATRPEWRKFAAENVGKHKVPTLRNVDLRPTGTFAKAYVHNGYFKTLSGLVHFYNTRDVKPACSGSLTEREALASNCWPAPEVRANMNTNELGNLGLSQAEERAIVAFMKTLSDGYTPAAGRR